MIKSILDKKDWGKEDLVRLLECNEQERQLLFAKAAEVKERHLGKVVYFRGLVEFSNHCAKDCDYCGIRKGNTHVERYNVSDEDILRAARFAWENHYGSMVLQSGELRSPAFTERIDGLLKAVKQIGTPEDRLGITLSVGEQDMETYLRWHQSGAHRYLLRIEASNPELYAKLHPNDELHSYERRIQALQDLQKAGYQTGTGVMIGLPHQTTSDLADDLLFMRGFDIDMVGMGPYIAHKDTPMAQAGHSLLPIKERFTLSLKMIAILRIMMKDINIAAATAMQAIDPIGREKAVKAGANVIMPNITPGKYRDQYNLYENKPCTDEEAEDCLGCLEARMKMVDHKIGFGQWGDSRHYYERTKQTNL